MSNTRANSDLRDDCSDASAVEVDMQLIDWLQSPNAARFYNYVKTLCRKNSDAEDITQEAILRTIKHFRRNPSLMYQVKDLAGYLLTVARNIFYDRLEKERKLSTITFDELDASERLDGQLITEPAKNYEKVILREKHMKWLAYEIRRLNPEDMRLFKLLMEEKKPIQIAEELNIEVEAARQRIWRLKTKLIYRLRKNSRPSVD